MNYISRAKFSKRAASFFILLMINQMFFPAVALALTSGPTQPELQSFEPVGTTEMVDLFSGDFTYNIPLFDLPGPNGGYPVNLFYNSVTSPEAEASMVGLGWNLGIGAINRQMRGLPDDFNGDLIEREVDQKPNKNYGLELSAGGELFSADSDLIGFGLNASLGLNFTYNNYKGFGMSVDPGVSASMGFANSGLGINAGFGMSLSSFESSNINASVNLSVKGGNGGSLGAGLTLNKNSMMGNSLGLSGQYSMGKAGGSISSSRPPAYTPAASLEFIGYNGSYNIDLGGLPIVGVTLKGGVRAYYSERGLKQGKFSSKAFGAMYLGEAKNEAKALQDYNREKQGPLNKTMKHLGIPSLTSDALSVTGQGIGGSYQLYRSDIPVFSDPYSSTQTTGASTGGEGMFGNIGDVGLDMQFNMSTSTNFNYRASYGSNLGAQVQTYSEGTFEPYYYKSLGELTAEPIQSDQYMGGDNIVYPSNNQLKAGQGTSLPNQKGRNDRKARTKSIQPYKNSELNTGLFSEFDFQFYDLTSESSSSLTYKDLNLETYSYEADKPNQLGAYTILSEEGVRWNYGLAVKNKEQKEYTFSVEAESEPCTKVVDIKRISGDEIDYKIDKTDEYLDITTTPSYAHSYMLTSILGNNYIDMDPSDGDPNDADQGYWVRFEYAKTSDNFMWRSPFLGANYSQGFATDAEDDKASFTAGKREQFYVARIETKTHRAEFSYSKRDDGRGANNYLQDRTTSTPYGDYSYKLDSIRIFSKQELYANNEAAVPMKVVHFEYSYELCPQTLNNATEGEGKLTLKKVYFTYENSKRGALNPYQFEYPAQRDANGTPLVMASYRDFGFDRWGVNRVIDEDPCLDYHVPYTSQTTPLSAAKISKQEMADMISIWHLKKIKLPSGSTIELDLERDEYGYEQDRVAGQMFNILAFGQPSTPMNHQRLLTAEQNLIAGEQTYNDLYVGKLSQAANREEALSVYIKLEDPITNDARANQQLDRYFTDLYEDTKGKQLFVRYTSNLFNVTNAAEGFREELSAYLYIDHYELVAPTNAGSDYQYAKIVLKDYGNLSAEVSNYHPLAVNAWQHIKFNLSDKVFGEGILDGVGDGEAKLMAIGRLFENISSAFKSFYSICSNRDYAKKADLKRTLIRLNTPDRRMFGDGLRVKRVVLKDHWTREATPVYGMVYNYDTEDENGQLISSGVASATPGIGKESSSLRYAKHYIKHLKGATNELFFFEYPFNESYYPGPSVGYSKVTVKSLATEAILAKRNGEAQPEPYQEAGIPSTLDGFASSGQSVHEFYTYKDFPIITEFSQINLVEGVSKFIPIPFVGTVRENSFKAKQGYKIELNGMHGRPSKVSQYAQDVEGNLLPEPISWVEYHYKHREETYVEGVRHRSRKVIENLVPVLMADQGDLHRPQDAKVQWMEMGVERELFVDNRKSSDFSTSGGFSGNLEVTMFFIFPIIVPMGLPNFNSQENHVETEVANKVIRRSPIMDKTVAYNGQSKVVTENLLYDKFTGQALLTKVNNNYDDAIYSYNLPAHFFYDGVGPAYKNWGAKLFAEIVNDLGDNRYEIEASSPAVDLTALKEGDELLATGTTVSAAKLTVLKKTSTTTAVVYADNPISLSTVYALKVMRSGARNQLSAQLASITALSDPSKNRAYKYCTTEQDVDLPTITCDNSTQMDAFINSAESFLNATLRLTPSYSSCSGGTPDLIANTTFCALPGGNTVPLQNEWTSLTHKAHQAAGECVFFGYQEEDIEANPSLCETNGLRYVNPAKIRWEPWNSALLNPIYVYQEATPQNKLVGPSLQQFIDFDLQTYVCNRLDSNATGIAKYPYMISYKMGDCNTFSGVNVLEIKFMVQTSPSTHEEWGLATSKLLCHDMNGLPASSLVPDTIVTAYRTINDVLNISASELSDDWLQMHASVSDNPYATGERGIYRMLNSYAYVDERRQTTPTVNLRKDGAMDSVALFEWNRPVLMQDCEAYDKWKKTNTITKYNGDNAETENRNIIGLYSSALYGYNGSLPIAVAANAKQEEIAFEGFEEYATTTDLNNLPHIETGQLNFGNQTATDYAIYHRLDISQPFLWTDGEIYLDEPYQSSWSNYYQGQYMRIHLRDEVGKVYSDRILIVGMLEAPNGNITIQYDPTGLSIPDTYRLTGAVSIERKLPSQEVSNTMASISDETAHTGNLSIKLQANGTFNFDNSMMELEADKAYVFSCWVKLDNADRPTYQPFVDLLTSSNLQLLSDMSPTGTIIDGWQRMEGQFSIPEAALLSATYEGLLGLQNKHKDKALYIDDLRIFPAEGGLQTYIYDPVNYKVRATLDNNNFFSRYLYNQEGTLIAVQKETERGIKTIQETGSHMKTTN